MADQNTQNQNILELDTSILFDDQEYRINASHADTAGSVDNTLVIKQHDDLLNNNVADIEFNGSNGALLYVVPKSGGAFTGPIQVPYFESLSDLNLSDDQKGKVVLNWGDIEKQIINLKGLPAVNWTGEDFKIEDFDDSVYSSFKIISGKDGDFESFRNKVANNFYYLYLTQDTGKIYLRVGLNNSNGDPDYIVLVRQLDKVSNAETLVHKEGDPPGTPDFTAKNLDARFKTLDLNNEESDLSKKLNALSERIDQLNTKVNNILDGTTTVAKASWAEDAENARSADQTRYADDADKVDGKHAYDLQKVIAVSPTAPTNPVAGDIWIKYSE